MLLDFVKNTGKKIDQELEADRELGPDVTEADFIPAACHYDSHTLLTKNGELMQILRITANADGVDYEQLDETTIPIRDAIRTALTSTLPSQRYAFWFHTLRRKFPISYAPQFPDGFAREIRDAWNKAHSWQHGFRNEIYISILREGQAADIFDMKEVSRGINPVKNRRLRNDYLESAHSEMETTTRAIIEKLSGHCNAHYLKLVQRQTDGEDVYYSEMLEFLHYLVNMEAQSIALSDVDVSVQISTNDLTFGFDALESRPDADDEARHFAAILTLKGAQDLSPEVLDKCLQIPEELIISQSFNFIPKVAALNEERIGIKEMLVSSQDTTIFRLTGLKDMFDQDSGKGTDFGEQQTSIMIVREHYKQLDEAIGKVQDLLCKRGLVTVREDIMLEDCFWAQLPGNFDFLRRKTPLGSNRMSSMARLNHFPSGNVNGSAWGPPVAILPTRLDTPYFFNFHVDGVGHTALLDFNSFADDRGAALLNFLLLSTRQYNGRLYVLDRNFSARPMIQAMNGSYGQIHSGDNETTLGMNPLQLEDTPRNRAFLAAWLANFVQPARAAEEATRELLRSIMDEIYTKPKEQRTLRTALALLDVRDTSLADRSKGRLIKLFSSETDAIDLGTPVHGFDLSGVATQRDVVVPVFSYLLHRIILSLDGTPTVIVLNEAWSLLDNDFFLPRIASLLQMLQQNNALMIFTTRHFEEHLESHLTPQILENTPTKIFLPDDIAVDYFPNVTKLTPRQVKTLVRMERQKGEFIVRHGREVVECVFTLAGMEKYRNTLSGDIKALRLMQIQHK